jgi:hypothetical protein
MTTRRVFLAFLSLPVVMPVARRVQAAYHRHRKACAYVALDIEISSPICVTLDLDGVPQTRYVFPPASGRQAIYLPIYRPAKHFRLAVASSSEPFKFYTYSHLGVDPNSGRDVFVDVTRNKDGSLRSAEISPLSEEEIEDLRRQYHGGA